MVTVKLNGGSLVSENKQTIVTSDLNVVVDASQADTYEPDSSSLVPPSGKVFDKWTRDTATNTLTANWKIAVDSIALDKSTLNVKVNETSVLKVTVLPNNATYKDVTWESSDSTVATVDNNGKVTGVKAGTAIITVASVDDCSKTATCTVTVTALTRDGSDKPSVAGHTKDSITLTTVDDNAVSKAKAEYSKDNGATWQPARHLTG